MLATSIRTALEIPSTARAGGPVGILSPLPCLGFGSARPGFMSTDQIVLFGLPATVVGFLVWGRYRYDLVAFPALAVAVAVAASCAFLTPIGHKNNTLVMGPGGYGFGDYWRMGLPVVPPRTAAAVRFPMRTALSAVDRRRERPRPRAKSENRRVKGTRQ